MINGCVCVWMFCRVEHVCTWLWRQQLQPSRHSGRRDRPSQQCAVLGRLIWEAVGGPLWSPTIHGQTHSTCVVILCSGIIQVLMFSSYLSRGVPYVFIHMYCICLFSTGFLDVWGECREHFILASLWKIQEDPSQLLGGGMIARFYVFACWIISPVICDSLCCCVFTLLKLPFYSFSKILFIRIFLTLNVYSELKVKLKQHSNLVAMLL